MVTCAGFVEPLNLQCWTVNILSGTAIIFTLLSIFFIALMAARFKMRGEVFGIIMFLFLVLFGSYYNGLYFLAVLLAGIMIFPIVKRVISGR